VVLRLSLLAMAALWLTGCSFWGDKPRSGAYFEDDGPPAYAGPDPSSVPDAVPRIEPLSKIGNAPYRVNGVRYVPMKSARGYKENGTASWYGRKFHGRRTSSGETYDMYAMSAAHKSLPLPSYARITNLANNKVVIVRVNDRGPFHGDRVIDLSYAAASKLDYRKTGVAEVLIEAIDPRTWTPAMEQSVRQQRNLSSYTAVKVVQVVKVVKAKPKAKSVAEPVNEIRQQRNRAQDYYVQIAAVSQISGVMLLRNTLTQALKRSDVFVEQASDRAGLFRVLIGPIVNGPSASVLMQEIVRLGHGQGVMIRP
jgi:rare lipoprotein A